MSNIKISQLPAATEITGDDLSPIVENTAGQTQKATFQQVLNYVTSSTFQTLTVDGVIEITGSLDIKNGNVNITENAYFFQGTSTGGGNVSLVGVNSSDKVVIGNAGYENIIDSDTHVSGNLEVSGTIRGDIEVSSNITAASYTLAASDYGKTLLFSSSATQDITCSSGLDVGFNVTTIQVGTGQLNFSGSGVTLVNRFAHTSSAGQYSAVSVIVLNGSQYLIVGDTA